VRGNLRTAIALFKEAGYELKGNRMVNTKTGKPFGFEILLSSPSFERGGFALRQQRQEDRHRCTHAHRRCLAIHQPHPQLRLRHDLESGRRR
jgi:ABC-type oligopeptide transport system substrate-binding subunit